MALLLQLVGDADLAKRRLLDRHFDHDFLDHRVDAVLLDRLAPRHLGQGKIAAFLVQLLKAIETVPAFGGKMVPIHFLVPPHPMILQAWETLPSCLASSSRPTFALMTFCSVLIVGFRFLRRQL